MSDSEWMVIPTVLVLLLASCTLVVGKMRPGNKLPPGPRSLPFLGNAHQVPKTRMWETFSEWAGLYGDIVYFRIIGRHFIVLNTAQAANDLLVKRSALYSDRPRFVMAGTLIGRETSLIFSPYGARLRKCRRMLHESLNLHVCSQYNGLLTDEAQYFIDCLGARQGPIDPSAYIRSLAGRTLIRIAYGSFTDEEGDLLIGLAHELALLTDQAVEPGKWLVDSFPFLRHVPSWFPGASFHKWAEYARIRNAATLHLPVDIVKSKMGAGTASSSFTSKLISTMSSEGKLSEASESIIASAASSFHAAGADTTTATIELFFLMMALHPDIQSKAQAEIDSVVGSGSTPGFEHRSALPYVEFIIKELYRFHPVAPLVPHATTEEDVYRGYHIPCGTGVFVNLWAICHNVQTYPQPDRFWPERYVDVTEGTNEDPRQWVFGFGRRICPGQSLADSMVYICVVRSLAAFQIKGTNIDQNTIKFTSGIVSHPESFTCNVELRH
ncbi:cytochrome P450 [Mycena galopus ATCC 62051]|nr:cytochrome P450 [Mycena galopus ATCC 62051]